MSQLREPEKGRLVFSVFAADSALVDAALDRVASRWGPLDEVGPLIPFPRTRYYEKEFGHPLVRRFAVAAPLVGQEMLVEVKVRCVSLEEEMSEDGRRKANIDPGLLTLERLVLATGKNYVHRIYLGRGVFADLTLVYGKGGFRPLEWTYPDYAAPTSLAWWNRAREGLRSALRESRREGKEE